MRQAGVVSLQIQSGSDSQGAERVVDAYVLPCRTHRLNSPGVEAKTLGADTRINTPATNYANDFAFPSHSIPV